MSEPTIPDVAGADLAAGPGLEPLGAPDEEERDAEIDAQLGHQPDPEDGTDAEVDAQLTHAEPPEPDDPADIDPQA
jgi:hypothetical protein